jgi:O-antigen/teichoic acid export membrane protein
MIAKQIERNGWFTALGFFLGAVNVLLLYTRVFTPEHYGTISFILASASLLFPFLSLGMQQTILRYFEGGDDKNRKQLASLSLQLISMFSVLLLFIIIGFDQSIANQLSTSNRVDTEAVYAIMIVGILMAYFELFFALTKVHFKTSAGVFLKEVFPRLGILLLLGSHFVLQPLELNFFLLMLGIIYLIRAIIMGIIAYRLMPFDLAQRGSQSDYSRLLGYSGLVILGSGLSLAFLEIDKVMLHTLSSASNVALYTVFVFMATTIAIPLRSVQPLYNAKCAALQHQQNTEGLTSLIQKTISISSYYGVLILAALLTFQPVLRLFLPEDYHTAFSVFPLLLALKLVDSSFTPLNAPFYYSKFYQTYLLFSLGFLLIMVVLNVLLIPVYGIYGAALATGAAVLLFSLLKVWATTKFLQIKALNAGHLVPALYGLVFLGAELTIHAPWLNGVRVGVLLSLLWVFWKKQVFSRTFLGYS